MVRYSVVHEHSEVQTLYELGCAMLHLAHMHTASVAMNLNTGWHVI